MFLHFTFIGPRVPYYISIVAINQLGEGNSAMAIAFTKAESKLARFIYIKSFETLLQTVLVHYHLIYRL